MKKTGGVIAGLLGVALAYGGIRTLFLGLSRGETVGYFLVPVVILAIACWLGRIAYRDLVGVDSSIEDSSSVGQQTNSVEYDSDLDFDYEDLGGVGEAPSLSRQSFDDTDPGIPVSVVDDIEFPCPRCSTRLRIAKNHWRPGARVRCPSCSNVISS